MKRVLLLCGLLSLDAQAAPLTNAQTYNQQHQDAFRNGTPGMIMVKGTTDNNSYMLEADPTTGAIPVSGSITATNPSVSATGAPVPAQATYVGFRSSTGNLTSVTLTAGGQIPVSLTSTAVATQALVRNDYTGSSITNAAYTQIIAATTGAINKLYIFDSSGQDIILAVGAMGSEVDTIYIQPGGNVYTVAIPAASRVSLKSLVAATVNTGEFLLTATN